MESAEPSEAVVMRLDGTGFSRLGEKLPGGHALLWLDEISREKIYYERTDELARISHSPANQRPLADA